MQNYSFNNWKEYAEKLGQFPGHQQANPFKAQDKDPGKDTRRTVNYFARAASIAHGNNPTYITPQFEQRMQAANANTLNAQYDQAKKQTDAQFAQRGVYGQGAHQAANNALTAERAKALAQNAAATTNQLAATKFDNWTDWAKQRFAWLNQLDQEAIQKQQLQLQRAQIAGQNRAVDAQRAAANNPFNWLGGLIGAGGDLISGGLSAGAAFMG